MRSEILADKTSRYNMRDPRDETDETEESKMSREDLYVEYMERREEDLAEIELDNM